MVRLLRVCPPGAATIENRTNRRPDPDLPLVYGLGGELVAEYVANASYSSPQKEYGYRNGQLLVTATIGTGWGSAPTYTAPDPLVAGVEIKLEHLTELRTAVNQLRAHAGLAAATFTVDPTPVRYATFVKADHILQLRTALEGARSHLGLSTGGYTHSGLAVGDPIYAIDFQELRNQIAAAWSSVQVNWLVSDQLGTPRMIFDESGSLSGVSRHDYLPFGEELFAGAGGRTTGQGYTGNDATRQKFTQKERDIETGLDYFGARYFASTQGRFSSPDPFSIIQMRQSAPNDDKTHSAFMQFIGDPRRWNRFAYAVNSPLVFTDRTGLDIMIIENHATQSNVGSHGTQGNPIGHTAIAITGRGVYSMGNGERTDRSDRRDNKNNILGGGVMDYLSREAPRRDTTIIIIKTTPEQDSAIEKSLMDQAASKPVLAQGLGILMDNCSTRVNAALDAGGIAAGSDGGIPPPALPGSAGTRALFSGLPSTTIEIPKDSNLSNLKEADRQAIQRFEPTQSNTEDRKMKPNEDE